LNGIEETGQTLNLVDENRLRAFALQNLLNQVRLRRVVEEDRLESQIDGEIRFEASDESRFACLPRTQEQDAFRSLMQLISQESAIHVSKYTRNLDMKISSKAEIVKSPALLAN
jgi:hypothetical protein